MSAAVHSARLLFPRALRARIGSEKWLFERTKAGDYVSYAEVYRRYRKPLYGFCLSRTHDPALAERAAQEAWARFLTLDAARIDDLRIWLFGLARNTCFEMSPLGSDSDAGAVTGVIAPGTWPIQEAWRREPERAVARALGRMRPRQRTALVLSELHGLTSAEIGEALGRSPEAVDKLLAIARRKFCRLYSDLRHLPVGCTVAFSLIYDGNGARLDAENRERFQAHVDNCPYCEQEAQWADKGVVFASALPLLATLGSRVEHARIARLESALGPAFTANPAGGVPAVQRYSVRAASTVALSAILVLPAAAFVLGAPGGAQEPASAETPVVSDEPPVSSIVTTMPPLVAEEETLPVVSQIVTPQVSVPLVLDPQELDFPITSGSRQAGNTSVKSEQSSRRTTTTTSRTRKVAPTDDNDDEPSYSDSSSGASRPKPPPRPRSDDSSDTTSP